jgi:hypothetical protein
LFDSGKTNSDYPLMFAVLIALPLLLNILYYVVVVLEKIFAGWAERSTPLVVKNIHIMNN